jgi:hypothetical protein
MEMLGKKPKKPMTPKQKKFAALAPPFNKATHADKIAGATKNKRVAAKKGRKITKKKSKRSGAKPKNAALYARVKAEAKRKFKVYPSAYANAWLVRTYKKRGGTYA